MEFNKKLIDACNKNNSLLCVGLDIDEKKIPISLLNSSKDPMFEFNKSIIEYTKDIVCAYKLNLAFYEVYGKKGIDLLLKTINLIPKDIVIIIDGKRNDIGNTAKKYAQTIFDNYKADATTLNPYMGLDSIEPFMAYKNKCSFILCRTSNPSARDFQDLKVSVTPIYQIVAKKIKNWNLKNNCGAVAGATYPEELRIIRNILGEDIPILIPGLGKQGGDIEKTIRFGTNKNGEMAIINSSRGIIYAGADDRYFEKSRDEALLLKNNINKIRERTA